MNENNVGKKGEYTTDEGEKIGLKRLWLGALLVIFTFACIVILTNLFIVHHEHIITSKIEMIHTGVLEDINCEHDPAFGNDARVCMVKFEDGTKFHLSIFTSCEFPSGKIGDNSSLIKSNNCYKIVSEDN